SMGCGAVVLMIMATPCKAVRVLEELDFWAVQGAGADGVGSGFTVDHVGNRLTCDWSQWHAKSAVSGGDEDVVLVWYGADVGNAVRGAGSDAAPDMREVSFNIAKLGEET